MKLSGRLICIFKFWSYSREIIFLLYRSYWRRTRKHFVSILKHEATPTICPSIIAEWLLNAYHLYGQFFAFWIYVLTPDPGFAWNCKYLYRCFVSNIMVYFLHSLLTTPIRSAVCMVLCVVFNVYVKQMTIVAKIWLDKKYKKTIGFTWNCFFCLPFCQKPHIEAIS